MWNKIKRWFKPSGYWKKVIRKQEYFWCTWIDVELVDGTIFRTEEEGIFPGVYSEHTIKIVLPSWSNWIVDPKSRKRYPRVLVKSLTPNYEDRSYEYEGKEWVSE